VTEVDTESLAELLDDCRTELAAAVDDLERTRAAHRTVESLLLAVLDHVPTALVVVDAEGRVRAASARAASAWGAQVGDLAGGVPTLGAAGLAETCRRSIEAGRVDGAVPDGFGAAVLDEPGTNQRYAIVWGTAAVG
jgi:nitrogen fixation/metabolism regulation signal transduction histidine kinase